MNRHTFMYKSVENVLVVGPVAGSPKGEYSTEKEALAMRRDLLCEYIKSYRFMAVTPQAFLFANTAEEIRYVLGVPSSTATFLFDNDEYLGTIVKLR